MRKTVDFTIVDEGRDKGKVFRLTEMPAYQAEKWAARALLALTHAGIDVPESAIAAGMQAVAAAGLQALGRLSFDEVEPLLDEMMGCVTIVRDPRNPVVAFPMMPDDIEEVRTIVTLRREIFALHTSFFQRRHVDLGVGRPATHDFTDYANVRPKIAALISGGMATLNELQTVYGVEDLEDLIEILAVDVHNRRVASEDDS